MPREPYKPLDPFRSPDAAADALLVDPLTPLQRRTLLWYHEHREQPLRLRPLVRRMLPLWCGLAITMVTVAVVASWAMATLAPRASDAVSYLCMGIAVGATIGAIARDMGTTRRTVEVWPALRDVIDWNKVAQRLDAGK